MVPVAIACSSRGWPVWLAVATSHHNGGGPVSPGSAGSLGHSVPRHAPSRRGKAATMASVTSLVPADPPAAIAVLRRAIPASWSPRGWWRPDWPRPFPRYRGAGVRGLAEPVAVAQVRRGLPDQGLSPPHGSGPGWQECGRADGAGRSARASLGRPPAPRPAGAGCRSKSAPVPRRLPAAVGQRHADAHREGERHGDQGGWVERTRSAPGSPAPSPRPPARAR